MIMTPITPFNYTSVTNQVKTKKNNYRKRKQTNRIHRNKMIDRKTGIEKVSPLTHKQFFNILYVQELVIHFI